MKEEHTVARKNRNREREEKIYSPMRTLFKLTYNYKNSILNTLERKRKQLFTSISLQKDCQLNKVSSTGNMIGNNYISKKIPQKKENHPFIDNKDNQIFNYFNNNYNNTIYNINMFNEHINENNKYKNSNENNNKIKRNISKGNNLNEDEKKKLKIINQRKKDELFKNIKSRNDNNNELLEESPSSGVFNYKISRNNKKTGNSKTKNNNDNKDEENKFPKIIYEKTLKDILMPYTSRESNHNNYLEFIKDVNVNENQNNITENNGNCLSKDLVDETNPNDLNMNGNAKDENKIVCQNANILYNMKKYNNKNVNNILINKKDKVSNIIYSPKRGIAHAFSHEKNKDIDQNNEQPNSLRENRIIYKNKSGKDIINNTGFTYKKKHFINKIRNINVNQPFELRNTTNDNKSRNKYRNNYTFSKGFNSEYIHDDNNKINNDNIYYMTHRGNNKFLDELKYDVEPDVYPEIQINLRNTKMENNKKNRNKSAIMDNNNKYNYYNNGNVNTDRGMIYQRNYYIQGKNINNSTDNNFKNTTKKNDTSMNNNINNINKSNINQNTNLSLSNNNISENDLISTSRLNNKNREKSFFIKGLYYILVLEEKIKDIADSLIVEKFESIQHYCFELINYNYNFNLNKYIHNAIGDFMDMNDVMIFNKYNIIAVMILYDLTFNETIFMNVKILIKEMLKLLYSNIILIITHLKDLINISIEKNSIVNHLINNLENKYFLNKELYMDDNEYLLIDENADGYCDEKINYNINFIIRNIHTIINNMKNTKNYNIFMNIFKNVSEISMEEINYFFRNKILKINIVNSPFLSLEPLKNNSINKNSKMNAPYIKKPSKKNYSLVISLDDTLLHFKAGMNKNNKGIVKLRPGLTEFFEAVKPYYEIIVFNCGNKNYCDLILNSFDNKNIYIDYKLNRDHCIIVKNDYIKDITKIGRDINKIIIVDNIPQNYRLNKENGIYIKSFYGDNPNDKVLYYLSKILVKIARNGGDVRDGIKKYWIEIINKISSNIFNNYY